MLVYYSFEGQQPWERTLLDQALGRGPNRNGGIVGCEWTEGRWPGKMALDFKRTSDRVVVDIPGEFEALTLMTWVRVDYFDNRPNALLLSDGWEPHELHWGLDGKGILIFAIKNGARCDSPVVLGVNQLGLWTHLATVTPRRGVRSRIMSTAARSRLDPHRPGGHRQRQSRQLHRTAPGRWQRQSHSQSERTN